MLSWTAYTKRVKPLLVLPMPWVTLRPVRPKKWPLKVLHLQLQAAAKDTVEAPASVVDPMQWWGALTQQFQQIASTALTEAAKQGALDTTRHMATDLAKEAFKTATDIATKGVQSVQEATRRAASAATTAPAPVRKTTAAKATTAAKDTTSPPQGP